MIGEKHGRPVIASAEELAGVLGIDVRLLYLLTNRTADFYRIYRIPKKNGKLRTIEAPAPILKLVQRRILGKILPEPVDEIATAFENDRSIIDNARIHCNAEVILTLDVKDFFPSLRYGLVRRFFEKMGYASDIAVALAKLCTLYGHLPQGAATSPHFSNLLLGEFDAALAAFCREREVAVSRYADDLTFSGALTADGIAGLIDYCRTELGKLGLRLNRRKIRVRRRGMRQEVTGLVVNAKVNVPREKKRRLRQQMYFLNKHWPAEAWKLDGHTLNVLLGKANFIRDIDRDNAEFAEYYRQLLEIKRNLNPD